VADGNRLGQAHRWFFFRPLADDITPVPDGDEFGAYRWVTSTWLIEQVVPFRRAGYRRVLDGASFDD
jgi:putative (di)nucleoside polyphosphate hydrolase